MSKIWIYGLNDSNDVTKKFWVYRTMNNSRRKEIAARWVADFGCSRVFEIPGSAELSDTWYDYVKTRYSRNGLADFAKFVFIDYLETEGTLIAKA